MAWSKVRKGRLHMVRIKDDVPCAQQAGPHEVDTLRWQGGSLIPSWRAAPESLSEGG